MGITVINKYKAAVVQAEPGWFDLELSVQKTIHWINEAGKAGCKLIAFPEMCKLTYHRWHQIVIPLEDIALTFSQGFPDTHTGCGDSTMAIVSP